MTPNLSSKRKTTLLLGWANAESLARVSGSEKGGLLEKGSFQKSPFSRDSREFRDSRDSRESPDCGKERRIRPFLEILENLEILEIPPVKRPLS